MDFKSNKLGGILKIKIILLFLGYGFSNLIIGCESSSIKDQEYIVGTRLDNISSQSDVDNGDTVSLFDKFSSRIHIFNINTMELSESYEVANPKDEHFLIASEPGEFVIDLSRSQITIFSRVHGINRNPIHFLGTPVSSAFNQTNRILIIYDDLNSVGILKLNEQGLVLKSWVGGPIIAGDSSILAGDITSSGNLIVSRSDNSLAIVDLEQSLDQQDWVYTEQTLSRNNIKWLAPIGVDKVLFQSDEALVLYDYVAEVEIDILDTVDLDTKLYSKITDAHVLYKDLNDNYTLAFSDGLSIRTRLLTNIGPNNILQSTLNISQDQWSIVKSNFQNRLNYNHEMFFINSVSYQRVVNSFRFSDMLSLSIQDLPDKAQLKQSGNAILALFPSELGYVKRIDINSGEYTELKLFNMRFL